MLQALRGFVFDLDGCVWQGEQLNPGAAETLAALHAAGRRVAYLTNNSRALGADMSAKLRRLGVTPPAPALTPLEIIGETIARRWGISRVLVMGAPELAVAVAGAGHTIVDIAAWREATIVAVGNDLDLSYERLAAAARAAAAGAPVVTPNIDARLPLENGDFLPGCGAIVEAVCVAAGVRPVVVGKPEPPLFRMALERLGLAPHEAAMVGDSVPSDMAGARAAGMRAVLYAPDGRHDGAAADIAISSFADLARLAGVAR